MNKNLSLILAIIIGIGFYAGAIEFYQQASNLQIQRVLGKDTFTYTPPLNVCSDYQVFKKYITQLYENASMNYNIFISKLNSDRDFVLGKLEILDNGGLILEPVFSYSNHKMDLETFFRNRLFSDVQIHLVPKPIRVLPAKIESITNQLLPTDSFSIKDSIWYTISRGIVYVKFTYGVDLGLWEICLMTAIWLSEGANPETAFGIRNYNNPYEKAEECAATILKNIDRFKDHLKEIETNPVMAKLFGKVLIATASLQLYKAGRNILKYFGKDVLKELAPNYLYLLNRGSESNITGGINRLNYAEFLLKFIPPNFNGDYELVARYFVQKFKRASYKDRFLIFASFFLPYEGMNYSNGYSPIWNIKESYNEGTWKGTYEENPGDFEINSNWGMNVYFYLNHLFNLFPFSIGVFSYF